MQPTVTLSECALRLKLSYGQALRLVFRGQLRGRQVDGRKWVVEERSVREFEATRERDAVPA